MARRKTPKRFWSGFWYVITFTATTLLGALILAITLKSGGSVVPQWQYMLLGFDVLLIIFLVWSRKFTTSETLAWGNKRS